MKPTLRAAELFRLGHDTVSIALLMNLPEHSVCRLLAMWRDSQPRKARKPSKPAKERRASA